MGQLGSFSPDGEEARSLSKKVAAKLREAIVEGRFAFGENISEEKLAAAFGVSRTPVRDALNSLQLTGLVEVRPKRGSFVFNPTTYDVTLLWEYREMLEREACLLALKKDPEALIADIRTIVDAMELARARGDGDAYARLDAHFHSTFFNRCGNGYLQDAYSISAARVATIMTLVCRSSEGLRDESLADHRAMLRSMEDGDSAAFVAILRRHLARTMDFAGRALPIR